VDPDIFQTSSKTVVCVCVMLTTLENKEISGSLLIVENL